MNDYLVPRLSLWLLTMATSALVLALLWATGLVLDARWSLNFVYLAAILALCVLVRAPRGWQDKALRCFEHVSLLSTISILGALGSYAVAAASGPFQDASLARADAWLGFDWVGLYFFTQQHPWLQLLGRIAYLTIFLSPTFLLVALTASGRIARVQAFILAYWVALAVTLVIFVFFPAQAPLVHYLGADPAYMPTTGIHHVATIEALQSGELIRIRPDPPYGLIAFPSFHAATAILFIWASWSLRWLRCVMLVANLAMLAATPIEGTHYLIDVIGGVIVAMVAIRTVAPAALLLNIAYERLARLRFGPPPRPQVAAAD